MLNFVSANEAAQHTARLRVELEQSRREQKEYLKQVELARVLDKRKQRKREAAQQRGEQVDESKLLPPVKRRYNDEGEKGAHVKKQKRKDVTSPDGVLATVLNSIF